MHVRCGLVGLVLVSVTSALTSCTNTGPPSTSVPYSVKFQVDRGADADAAARQFEWIFGRQVFLYAPPAEGVTLGCNLFRRTFIESGDAWTVRDSGHVYIHNDTGETMYDTIARISDVSADTDGAVRAVFGVTRFDYGDIPSGGGDPGPDGRALDGDEQDWSYDCDAGPVDEAYLDNLKFTVTVTWLADP